MKMSVAHPFKQTLLPHYRSPSTHQNCSNTTITSAPLIPQSPPPADAHRYSATKGLYYMVL
ncbi:hypothetical protein X798_00176 [Onchocerca flexuosa]|uniref:Uncharacterized protein n=1 Tax=Onchocerca flexuosa TaxID=387005 RepID=A0A238C609_9BILA|nr:hypothetical protein X798_00176 [Onchocerca flexuosa]